MFEKGQKVDFKVIGSKVSGGDLYFQVKVRSTEYDIKGFDFQRKRRPERLSCIVKEIDAQGNPVLTQDLNYVVPQLYRKGETYEFRVKSDLHPTGQYHEVTDWNGLLFRVPVAKQQRLALNQLVKCRVKDVKGMKLELELIIAKQDSGIPLLSLERLLSIDSSGAIAPHLPALLFDKLPEFEEARKLLEAEDPLWVINAADTVSRNLNEWLNSELKRNKAADSIYPVVPLPDRRRELLTFFESICTNLLENNDFLKLATPEQRIEYQDRLNRIITHARDYLTAMQYIDEGRDQDFIDETLTRLKLSGYLYRPEERMRVMMSLFTLRKKTVTKYIDDIFDIIRDSYANERFMQIFANAFVEMLDMYIANESRFINVLTSVEDTAHRMMLHQMIRALALRILLHRPGVDPDSTIAIYRSMLYRYTTLVQSVDSNRMMGKALAALFGDVANLEFTWSDLRNDLNFLCAKITAGGNGKLGAETWVFETPEVAMALEGDTFTFTPVVTGSSMHNAVAPDVFEPHRINILLNERPNQRLNASRNNIRQFHALWSEIEASLFAKSQKLNPMRLGHSPEVGDEVTIRVERKVAGRTFEYHAVIEHPTYVGHGIITPRQIISYGISPSIDVFKDSETGVPMLFKAVVEERYDDGTFLFSMREQLLDALRDIVELGGDAWLAQVSGFIGDRVLFITEGGYVVYSNRWEVDDDIKENDFVLVVPELIHDNGHIHASYYGRAEEGEVFTRSEAFHNLLAAYSDGQISTVSTAPAEQAECVDLSEARSAQRFIVPDMMRELMHIVDRQAMLCGDHIKTYCYLAVARIMSRLIGDSHTTGYLQHRMELVEAIQLFGDDGIIDDILLERLLEDNKDFIASYPDIQQRLTRLRLINRLDKPQPEEWMWELATAPSTDIVTSQLARLVLSHNLLRNANLYEGRRQILSRIRQLLDLKIKLPESMQVAEEDQFTELKTSIIYPAGKENRMAPNPTAQLTEILRKVAGMLNARGGKLYVGVNDSGYATGLHNDFTYLNNNHHNYDLTSIKDKFDRMVRTEIHNRLGRHANSLVNSGFETVADKVIYRLDIEPSNEVVTLDGLVYERQGTSCWTVPPTEIKKFEQQRKSMNF